MRVPRDLSLPGTGSDEPIYPDPSGARPPGPPYPVAEEESIVRLT